jgi:ornithine cyclodeaminase/alanine dehydrogenase
MTRQLHHITDADMQAMKISPGDVADAIEAALLQKQAGELHTAPKSAILPGQDRYMMSTLGVGDYVGLTVLKAVTVSPENPSRGLPSITGAIMALDSLTGELIAVLGADWITAVRTAALSAVAARRLANPDASVVAFVGCGVQAHSHLAAFADMFPLTEVRAFGRGAKNREKLCQTAREMGLKALATDDPQEALDGADLVVTSVTLDYSIAPFLDAGWLKPGSFASITDLSIPWHQDSLLGLNAVVVDDCQQEAESARKLVAPHAVAGDLTDLVTGNLKLSTGPDRRMAFAFRGIALGDFAATALVLERAGLLPERLGIPT